MTQPIKKTRFREDINGLRAIAVISVVLFHFAPEKLPGGFVGVDVFFVISGYLMTSIIFRGFENNNFLFGSFILNRAKRIIPALLVLTLLLLAVGYATLGPDAYKLLAKHAKDSLLFISNITYKNESGYFDAASNTKFLLHTWSLSVEWQFYIVYPLILLLSKKILAISTLKILVVCLFVISLTISILITKHDPETAYFMFYTRAWEMIFGGLAFLYPLKSSFGNRARFSMEVLGLLIIAISIFKINTHTPWPGYMALLPVIGTYLCILARNSKTVLSGYIIEKIGLWSYSIYLVHWPIIVFNHTLNWELSFKKYILIVFVLAFLSYQLIEKRRKYKWGLLLSFSIILLMSIYIKNTNGIESRFNVPQQSTDSLMQGNLGWKPRQWLLFNGDESVDYIFYGDSFSSQYTNYFEKQNKSLANIYEGECLSTPNFYSHHEVCRDLYDLLIKNSKNNPSKNLVIIQSWSHALKGLKNKVNGEASNLSIDDFVVEYKTELESMKSELTIEKVILVGSNTNFVGLSPTECLNQKFNNTIYNAYFNKQPCSDVTPQNIKDNVNMFNIKLAQLAEQEEWLYFIDPNEARCTNHQCLQIQDNQSLYADHSHFSVIGANIVGKYIFNELEKIIQKPSSETDLTQ